MMGNPSRRTERITKQSDESNWRNRKWEKPIQEDESPLVMGTGLPRAKFC